jgi:hypothetical protein
MATRTVLGSNAAAGSPAIAWIHLVWLGAGLLLGFLVPLVLADVLEVQKDVYYGIYSAFALGLFIAWARSTGQSLREMLRRRWPLAILLGLAFAGVMAAIALNEDAGSRPEGLDLVGAILWRGLLYGMADGLLLSSFPILVVFAAFAGTRMRQKLAGTLVVGLIAVLASLAMTAAYHLGYSDFRSDKLRKPVAGDLVWSAPTLLTLNPIGAPIAHAGLHVTAVVHNSDTDLFLPPHD